MMTFIAYLPLILLVLIALFSGITVVSIVIAIRASREHYNTIFPLVQEVEGIKARRARIAAITFLVLTGLITGAWVATQGNPGNILIASTTVEQPVRSQQPIPATFATDSSDALAAVEASAEDAAVSSDNGLSPVTEAPSVAINMAEAPSDNLELPSNPPKVVLVTSTPTPEAVTIPTASPTSIPTPTLQPTEVVPPPVIQAGEVASISLPRSLRIGPITFAANITERREAVAPAKVFDPKTEKVYAIFPYDGMINGLPFSVVWYYQGREFFRDEYEWHWGSKDRFYAFVKPSGTGNYRVEVKIGSETLASGEFSVHP